MSAAIGETVVMPDPAEFDGIPEVCMLRGSTEHVRIASFPLDAIAGQVGCMECGGSGWWGYAAYAVEPAECVDCKGTGRVWVGLW